MTMNNISVSIPKSDMPFFRKLSRKMGWSYSDKEALKEKQEILDSIERSFLELKEARESGKVLPGVEELFEELSAV